MEIHTTKLSLSNFQNLKMYHKVIYFIIGRELLISVATNCTIGFNCFQLNTMERTMQNLNSITLNYINKLMLQNVYKNFLETSNKPK